MQSQLTEEVCRKMSATALLDAYNTMAPFLDMGKVRAFESKPEAIKSVVEVARLVAIKAAGREPFQTEQRAPLTVWERMAREME